MQTDWEWASLLERPQKNTKKQQTQISFFVEQNTDSATVQRFWRVRSAKNCNHQKSPCSKLIIWWCVFDDFEENWKTNRNYYGKLQYEIVVFRNVNFTMRFLMFLKQSEEICKTPNWVIRLFHSFRRSQVVENTSSKGCLMPFGHFRLLLQNTIVNANSWKCNHICKT